MNVHGIQGSLSVYEPEVNLESDTNVSEATSSIILIGRRNETEFIVAGWGVILFILWKFSSNILTISPYLGSSTKLSHNLANFKYYYLGDTG
jgi:hypothetical protein